MKQSIKKQPFDQASSVNPQLREQLIANTEAIFLDENPNQFNVSGINQFIEFIKQAPILEIDFNDRLRTGPHKGCSVLWTLTYIMNSCFNGFRNAQQTQLDANQIEQLKNNFTLFQQMIGNIIRNIPFENLDFNSCGRDNESVLSLLSLAAFCGNQEPLLILISKLTPAEISTLDLNLASTSEVNAGITPLWWLARAAVASNSIALAAYINRAGFEKIEQLNTDARSSSRSPEPNKSIRDFLANTPILNQIDLAKPLTQITKAFLTKNITSKQLKQINQYLEKATEMITQPTAENASMQHGFVPKIHFFAALSQAYKSFLEDKALDTEQEKIILDELITKARISQGENPFDDTIYFVTLFLKQFEKLDLLISITNQIPVQNPRYIIANTELSELILSKAIVEQDPQRSQQLYKVAWIAGFRANNDSICYKISYAYCHGKLPDPTAEHDKQIENKTLIDLHFSRLDLLKEKGLT